MKKYLALFLLALGLSASAHASTTKLVVPQGFNGGSFNGFTYTGQWLSLGDPVPFISFYEGTSSTLTYDSGSFDFTGFSMNGRPWNGYNDHFPVELPGNPPMTMTFKDINGNTLATGSINLAASDDFVTYSQYVKGVHSIEFSAQKSQFFVRVASVSMVPEAETYAMMLAGLALLGAIRRKVK